MLKFFSLSKSIFLMKNTESKLTDGELFFSFTKNFVILKFHIIANFLLYSKHFTHIFVGVHNGQFLSFFLKHTCTQFATFCGKGNSIDIKRCQSFSNQFSLFGLLPISSETNNSYFFRSFYQNF